MVSEPDTVLRAFDRGINFFFVSADMHWPRYEAMRQGLARLLARGGVRDRFVVASVSYATQPEFVTTPHLELLEAIPSLEHIDVLVAGGAYGHEIGARAEPYRAMVRRRHVGARAFGISFHDRHAAAHAMERTIADVVFIRYNPAHPRAREIVFPATNRAVSVPLFSFKSTTGWLTEERLVELGLASHHWRPRVTDYYRFALTSAELDGVLCAPNTPDQIDDLADAMARGPLTEEEQQYLLNLADIDAGHARLRGQPQDGIAFGAQ
jgi:hypothetical protein